MIELGKPAPELSALDTHGRPVSLGDYRGHSAVLIYFMRATTCPMCNSHVRDLASHAYEPLWDERRYPPKAILGTAYEFATGRRLDSGDFEGGKAGAVRVLAQLGFTVQPKPAG